MKVLKSLLAASCGLLLASPVHAQVQTPAPSPASKLVQDVGLTEFTIEYARPGAKNRTVYGELVPYGDVWRTGANAATRIAFDSDIHFGGEAVAAGEYALYTIPGEDRWTVILYEDTSLWGSQGYDKENDVVRVEVEPEHIESFVETFTIDLQHLRDGSAMLHLDWAHTRVPVEIELDTVSRVEASIEAAMQHPDSLRPRDYASAAAFYLQQETNLEQAAEWMKKALDANENAFWWEHTYARILAAKGDTEAALAAAESSLEKARAAGGSAFGYIRQNEELIESLQ